MKGKTVQVGRRGSGNGHGSEAIEEVRKDVGDKVEMEVGGKWKWKWEKK
jgi:hypothetical protein